MKAGKSLDQIQKDVKMPEYASWASQERYQGGGRLAGARREMSRVMKWMALPARLRRG